MSCKTFFAVLAAITGTFGLVSCQKEAVLDASGSLDGSYQICLSVVEPPTKSGPKYEEGKYVPGETIELVATLYKLEGSAKKVVAADNWSWTGVGEGSYHSPSSYVAGDNRCHFSCVADEDGSVTFTATAKIGSNAPSDGLAVSIAHLEAIKDYPLTVTLHVSARTNYSAAGGTSIGIDYQVADTDMNDALELDIPTDGAWHSWTFSHPVSEGSKFTTNYNDRRIPDAMDWVIWASCINVSTERSTRNVSYSVGFGSSESGVYSKWGETDSYIDITGEMEAAAEAAGLSSLAWKDYSATDLYITVDVTN